MKKCNSCNIEFNTIEKLCPLCQNKLSGESKNIVFPKNIRLNTNTLILKILLFSSVVICILSSFLELYVMGVLKYNIYVYLGFITNYCVIYFILKNSKNILGMIERYGIVLITFTLIWYFVTKSHIITNYIIPSIALFELVFNLIIGIILRKNYLIKYSGLILVNIILLILPVLLVLFGLTTNNLMSYICLTFALITISGLLIFFLDDIKEELSKIFNI